MTDLGTVIRRLIDDRGKNQKIVAKEAAISEVALSNILTGKSRPRQVNLSRLMAILCKSPEDEQVILSAYDRAEGKLPESPSQAERPVPGDEIERVTRYLEVKSMSVAFANDVESTLIEAGIDYQKEYRNDPFICDFMLVIRGLRVAIDCKYNVNRDWDRTYATAKLLRENLPCDEVVIVIPYENELARNARDDLGEAGGQLVSLENLRNFLTTQIRKPL